MDQTFFLTQNFGEIEYPCASYFGVDVVLNFGAPGFWMVLTHTQQGFWHVMALQIPISGHVTTFPTTNILGIGWEQRETVRSSNFFRFPRRFLLLLKQTFFLSDMMFFHVFSVSKSFEPYFSSQVQYTRANNNTQQWGPPNWLWQPRKKHPFSGLSAFVELRMPTIALERLQTGDMLEGGGTGGDRPWQNDAFNPI